MAVSGGAEVSGNARLRKKSPNHAVVPSHHANSSFVAGNRGDDHVAVVAPKRDDHVASSKETVSTMVLKIR